MARVLLLFYCGDSCLLQCDCQEGPTLLDMTLEQLPHVNVFKHFGIDAEKNALRFSSPRPCIPPQHALAYSGAYSASVFGNAA